ncbi:hypothetical protein PoB_007237900 [Plakobranchus ocellatus]|uniref:Uncharacterized protein n=1 Tax=Plakobranchus ocellatus TaxID=259542 RepID=A0AAV4DNY2_9GAST|nr:hypothetical protein PoB_007237900 [Plakobranchus ocellatus]
MAAVAIVHKNILALLIDQQLFKRPLASMNNFDDSYDDVQIVVYGRRKRANKAEHSREKLKPAKHSCGGKIPQISCQHDASKSQCWAEYLTGADLSLNQDRFYGARSKLGYHLIYSKHSKKELSNRI